MLTLDISALREAVDVFGGTYGWNGRRVRAHCVGCNDERDVFELVNGERLSIYPHCAVCHGLHRACIVCGECLGDDSTQDLSRRTCSSKCRQKAYRKRKRG